MEGHDIHDYIEGIHIAREEGLIVSEDPDEAVHTMYDHMSGSLAYPILGTLDWRNSHPLEPAMRSMLQWLVAHGHVDDSFTFFDAGAGSGTAAYEAHTLLQPAKGRVETVNRSPINPYLGVPGDPHALRKTIADAIGLIQEEEMRERLVANFSGNIPLDTLQELERWSGMAILKRLPIDKPYIARQWVGRFPRSVTSKERGATDVFYERNGALLYTGYDQKSLDAARSLLSPRGLVMAKIHLQTFDALAMENAFRAIGTVVLDSRRLLFIAIAKQHPFHALVHAEQTLEESQEPDAPTRTVVRLLNRMEKEHK